MSVKPLHAVFAAAGLLGLTAAAPAAPRYAIAGSIAGPDGGWDYANVDPASGRLYVARSASVTVGGLGASMTLRSIGSIAHGHAVVPLPGGKLLLVTSGADDGVRLLDARDGREVARIAVGKDPDAAFYDAAHRRAVVMNAKAGTVSLIDVAARAVSRTITLKPGLDFGQAGPDDTLFVTNEDANELKTADLATGAASAAIPLPGCEAPSGLAYDPRSHLLVSACANGKAAVVDARTRRLTGLLDIGSGPDAVILDAARRLAFIPCGKSGTLSVISLVGVKPVVIGTIATARGAKTGALDPRDGVVYLPTADIDPPAQPGGRPVPRPGTFDVLVVSPVRDGGRATRKAWAVNSDRP